MHQDPTDQVLWFITKIQPIKYGVHSKKKWNFTNKKIVAKVKVIDTTNLGSYGSIEQVVAQDRKSVV